MYIVAFIYVYTIALTWPCYTIAAVAASALILLESWESPRQSQPLWLGVRRIRTMRPIRATGTSRLWENERERERRMEWDRRGAKTQERQREGKKEQKKRKRWRWKLGVWSTRHTPTPKGKYIKMQTHRQERRPGKQTTIYTRCSPIYPCVYKRNKKE